MIAFDDMIADMFSNKKLNPIVTELFISGRKPLLHNLLLHCFVMKIPNKREL